MRGYQNVSLQSMKKNLFVAFEGIDGSGKSTQVNLLAQSLEKAGHKVYCTFEPTGSPIGTIIRKIFKHEMEADERVIAALFAADRLDHLLNKENGIIKKLEEGYTVITDRYYFSSYAYHSVHVPMEWVIETNSLSAGLLRPDINIYIDVDPELSMKRLNSGRSNIELYETLENLTAVRKKYMEAFELLKAKEHVFITDGNQPIETIAANIWKEIVNMAVQNEVR